MTKWYDSSPTGPPHATAISKKSYRSSNKGSKKITLMPKSKADQNTTGRSTKKWSCAAKTSTKSSIWWAYESSSTTSTTATQPSGWCTPYSQPCPADSKTTFPPQNSGCTNRSTPQSWATAANHWKYRCAPTKCTSMRNTALPPTGGTKKPKEATLGSRQKSTKWRGCANSWTGRKKQQTPTNSSTPSATT